MIISNSRRRFNPLTGEWVLVSSQRTQRPWQGKVEMSLEHDTPEYVKECYLCPGNVRANGDTNPDYKSTFVFENDFSALKADEQNVLLKNRNYSKQRLKEESAR